MILVAAVVIWHQVRAKSADTEQAAQEQPAASTQQSPVANDSDAQNDASVFASTKAAASSQMILQIVEAETGQPLPHAKLHLFYLLEDGRGKVVKAATDANGKLGVDMPQAPYRALNMFVSADGHVPKVTSWASGASCLPNTR